MFQISVSELFTILVVGVLLLKPKEFIILLKQIKKLNKIIFTKNPIEEARFLNEYFNLFDKKNIRKMKNGNLKR